MCSKGQLISKRFLGSSISFKKRTKLLCDMFSFVFWKKLKTPKRHFKINWPLDTLDLLKDLFFPPAALANEDIKEEEKSFKGQHEGPFINPELSPNVTGVLGKEVRLACHVEHLANKTVSRSFYEIKPSLPPTQKIC